MLRPDQFEAFARALKQMEKLSDSAIQPLVEAARNEYEKTGEKSLFKVFDGKSNFTINIQLTSVFEAIIKYLSEQDIPEDEQRSLLLRFALDRCGPNKTNEDSLFLLQLVYQLFEIERDSIVVKFSMGMN